MASKKFGRYAILEEIGRGGMATVYRAYDPHFEREVALKVLPPQLLHDPTFQTRFSQEARIIAALEHAAIVPVYDFGEEAGQPYYVMRLMTGGSLADRLKQGPISPGDALHILSRVADALDEAHNHGFLHRDLKPGNILFDARDTPFLSDFGIAKLIQISTPITSSNIIIGTPAYMSPEQGRGDRDIDGRSDIYALGALLFQMLSGRVPYESETPTGQIIRHITEPVPNILELKPDLPPGVQTVIERSMAKEKGHRYNTVGEMVLSLERAVSGEVATPPPKSIPTEATSGKAEPASLAPIEAEETTEPPSESHVKPPSRPSKVKSASRRVRPKVAKRKRKLPVWGWITVVITALLVVTLIFSGFIILRRWVRNVRQPTSTMPVSALVSDSQSSTTPSLPPTDTATPEPLVVQEAYKAVANVDALPVRSGPGTTYFVIERYPKGISFDVVGRSEDDRWLAVRVPNTDNTGWVRLDTVLYEGDMSALVIISVILQPSDTPQPSTTPGAVVNELAARLRSGPGMNYDILVNLLRGTGMVVIGRSADAEWLFVFVPDEEMEGWVAISTLIFDYDLDELSVIEAPPSPTPAPIMPEATQRPKKTPTSAPPPKKSSPTPYP